MAKFCMRWEMNHMFVPTNPEERVKFWFSMLESVRAELKSGALTDWGIFPESREGYALAETDEKSLQMSIMKWVPYFIFDIKPVLSVDQTIDSLKRVTAKK